MNPVDLLMLVNKANGRQLTQRDVLGFVFTEVGECRHPTYKAVPALKVPTLTCEPKYAHLYARMSKSNVQTKSQRQASEPALHNYQFTIQYNAIQYDTS